MEEGSNPPLLSLSLTLSTELEGNSDIQPRGQTGYKTVFIGTEVFFPMCVTLNRHVYETPSPSSVVHVSLFFACLLSAKPVGGTWWGRGGQVSD